MYLHVLPTDHDEGCHRGLNVERPGQYDTEHCKRCRGLWSKISVQPQTQPCPVAAEVTA